MWKTNYDNSPSLYLVPTPIGNLEDMTFRAINVLKNVNIIFCEDTRVTLKLLNYFDIKKKLISLHDYNEERVKEQILKHLKNNENVAIVSDQGTPIISDPGYKTVNYIINMGYNVITLPGACALIPAVVSSGISSEHFLFYGFLNNNENKKKKELNDLSDYEYTLIFYESPHRFKKTIELMYNIFGDRYISISREISKKYESIFYGYLSELNKNLENIKGEIVIVIEGNQKKEDLSNISIVDCVNIYINNGYSIMDSIKKVAKDKKISKNDVYMEYHSNK